MTLWKNSYCSTAQTTTFYSRCSISFFAWIAWLLIHILFLVGLRNKLSVLLGWAYAYLFDKPEARIIIHPPAFVTEPKA